MEPDGKITSTVPHFLRQADIGLTKLYELINSGEIQSIKIGKRRLIVLESYRDFIKRQTQTKGAS
jgi:hypothetical protein